MSKKTTKVSKIILTIGEKEIALTPAEVKELKEALDQMYPEQKYSPPVIIERYTRPWWEQPYYPYYCSASGNVSLKAEGHAIGDGLTRTTAKTLEYAAGASDNSMAESWKAMQHIHN
jgi:hypothetical protein